MLDADAAANVLEAAAHRQRRRGQDNSFEILEERLLQNLRDIDGSRLQEDILLT